MKILVTADTHIPVAANVLPPQLLEAIKDADLILHAGDFIELDVLRQLQRLKSTEAVAGNMDSPEVSKLLPRKKVLNLKGFKIGLMHGRGSPYGLLNMAQKEFRGVKNLSCVIYAHSHNPDIKTINSIIYFNPGSPTDKIFAPYNSYGILEITDKITPRIIRI